MENNAPNDTERRKRRSNDTMTALHYQLAFARREGEFDALVLADESGFLVAGAGSWPTCEMLAAYAPLLATPTSDHGFATELRAISTEVQVQTFCIDGSQVVLCARGGGQQGRASMNRAVSGCSRILSLSV